MPTLDEIRAQRPREVVTARTLAIVAAVLWIPLLGYSRSSLEIAMFVLYVVGAFGVAKGRHGALIMQTIALVVLYLGLLPYTWLGFNDPYLNGPAYAVMDMTAVLLSALGIFLAYGPSSRAFIKQVGKAMDS